MHICMSYILHILCMDMVDNRTDVSLRIKNNKEILHCNRKVGMRDSARARKRVFRTI